jgi:hypothetical protein
MSTVSMSGATLKLISATVGGVASKDMARPTLTLIRFTAGECEACDSYVAMRAEFNGLAVSHEAYGEVSVPAEQFNTLAKTIPNNSTAHYEFDGSGWRQLSKPYGAAWAATIVASAAWVENVRGELPNLTSILEGIDGVEPMLFACSHLIKIVGIKCRDEKGRAATPEIDLTGGQDGKRAVFKFKAHGHLFTAAIVPMRRKS